MTTQIPDTCIFDGRKCEIEEFSGDITCIPSNQQLGISTKPPHTANWRGRIDHFAIYKNRLYLQKTEVCLDEESQLLAKNFRREVLVRYEPMHSFGNDGKRTVIKEYRFEYLLFDDLFVPYTGELILKHPCEDIWNHPCINDFYEKDFEQTVEFLEFESGILV